MNNPEESLRISQANQTMSLIAWVSRIGAFGSNRFQDSALANQMASVSGGAHRGKLWIVLIAMTVLAAFVAGCGSLDQGCQLVDEGLCKTRPMPSFPHVKGGYGCPPLPRIGARWSFLHRGGLPR